MKNNLRERLDRETDVKILDAGEEDRLVELLEQIVDIDLEKVTKTEKGYSALCPAHDDHNPSLVVFRGDSGEIVFHCYAGCNQSEIVESLGLAPGDLWPRRRSRVSSVDEEPAELPELDPGEESTTSGLTLASLAEAKALPVDFLRGLGMLDYDDGVIRVAYFDAKKDISAIRLRSDVVAKKGSKWGKDSKLIPYGVWRLKQPKQLFLVEGESDCWTLWHHGYSALGMPGATNTKLLTKQQLHGVNEVFVVREPDDAGKKFAIDISNRLDQLGFTGKLFVLDLDGAKDPSELHVQDPAGFVERFGNEVDKATAKGIFVPGVYTAAQVEYEPIEWLSEGRIVYGKLQVWDGDPGLGKSMLTVELAAAVTTGRAFLAGDRVYKPGAVIMINEEDAVANTIKPRLEAAKADASKVYFLDEPTKIPDDLADLERKIRKLGVKLVIWDPFLSYLPGSTDSYKDQQIKAALTPLAKLADRTGVAVILIRHLNKKDGGKALTRGGGSIGIIGTARLALLVAEDPGNPEARVVAVSKSNLGEKGTSQRFKIESAENGVGRIKWLGQSTATADELVQTHTPLERNAVVEAEGFLKQLLAKGPVPAKTVQVQARHRGISVSGALERAKKNLGIRSEKQGGQWTWTAPQLADNNSDEDLKEKPASMLDRPAWPADYKRTLQSDPLAKPLETYPKAKLRRQPLSTHVKAKKNAG